MRAHDDAMSPPPAPAARAAVPARAIPTPTAHAAVPAAPTPAPLDAAVGGRPRRARRARRGRSGSGRTAYAPGPSVAVARGVGHWTFVDAIRYAKQALSH